MGVYIRLYAPIFNYVHMSQAEKNNSNTTQKEPRLYNRGNDQIDLDDYIRNLESGFDTWLNSRKIKDKYKVQVREAYREMISRLNSGDGSFTSRLGGGFQDSTGKLKNAEKGFDAAGIAASYLGKTLRGMDIYKEPTQVSDSFKEDNRETVTAQTPSIQPTSTTTPTDDAVVKRGRTYADKIKAIEQRWRPYTGQLVTPITIGSYSKLQNMGPNILQTLENALNNASTQDLTLLLRQLINNEVPSDELDFIKNLFPTSDSESHNPIFGEFKEEGRYLLLNNILNILKNRTADHSGGLHNFGEDNLGAYYIGGTATNRNTGFVYDSNNHTISEMSIHDIPYWQTYINNWWDSQEEPSNDEELNSYLTSIYKRKNGGIIQKFDNGGKTGILSFNPKRNNIYFTGNFNNYDNWHANNIVLPWLRAYKNASDQDWETLIKAGLDSWNNAGGFDWYNATDEQRQHGMQSAGTQIHQQYIIDNLPGLNTEIAKHSESYNIPARANTNDRFVDGIVKGTDTDFGIQTGNRRPSIHIKTTGQDLDDWDSFYQNLGYVGRYQYLDHWVPTKNVDQEGLTLFKSNTTSTDDAVSARKAVVASTQQPGAKTAEQLFGQTNSNIDEVEAEVNKPSNRGNLLNTAMEWMPDLIGGLRLPLSIRANNRITDIIRPSLKPVLKDTYERYSPVTGAFSTMQLKNREGSEVLSAAYRPFTSDASLAAARMLEGQMQANKLQTEGFLADDQEIKRTKAEALARQEDNMARRSEVANFNRASINQTNRERARLEATRVNKNWRSWDNFLGGIESRMRQRYDEDRYDRLAYQAQQDELSNSLVYQDELNQIQDLVSKYQTANPNKSISSAPWWNSVSQRQTELMRRLSNDNIISAGKRRGYNYTDLYKDNPYIAKDWSKIII